MAGDEEGQESRPAIDDFLVDPPRQLDAWRWLWEGDHRFPIRSHRVGLVGRLIVLFKRVFRPLVQVPQNDLWDRQRAFNLILLERLQSMELRLVDADSRLRHLEALGKEGLNEVMRHNDALFTRVDQKLDRYRREARELKHLLAAALAVAETQGAAPLSQALDESGYVALEDRYRGTRQEIEVRISRYLAVLATRAPVLDLGCGRGEALTLLKRHGIPATGVDSSAEMVRLCRKQGLEAENEDLFEALAQRPAGSLGGVVSFHVVEHLQPEAVDRLVRLAWRALREGGALILETPSPLSLSVTGRSFWLDPTHRRPVHPESLKLAYRLAGFDQVEQIDLNPFPPQERLPEIDVSPLPPSQRALADGVNRLRDHLDGLLYGYQDYALVGIKDGAEEERIEAASAP